MYKLIIGFKGGIRLFQQHNLELVYVGVAASEKLTTVYYCCYFHFVRFVYLIFITRHK